MSTKTSQVISNRFSKEVVTTVARQPLQNNKLCASPFSVSQQDNCRRESQPRAQLEIPQYMLSPPKKAPKPEDSNRPRPRPVWPPRPKRKLSQSLAVLCSHICCFLENPNPFIGSKRPMVPGNPIKPFRDQQQKRESMQAPSTKPVKGSMLITV